MLLLCKLFAMVINDHFSWPSFKEYQAIIQVFLWICFFQHIWIIFEYSQLFLCQSSKWVNFLFYQYIKQILLAGRVIIQGILVFIWLG